MFTNYQTEIIFFVQQQASILPDYIWANITDFGDLGILLAIFFSSTFQLGRSRMRINLLSAVPAAIITPAIKSILALPRPPMVLDLSKLNIIGDQLCCKSFPSGHTTSAATFCALIFLNTKNIYGRITALLLFVLVGLSRVVVGAHWPLDVVAGAIIGLGATIISFKYFSGKLSIKQLPTAIGRRYKIIILIITLIFLVASAMRINNLAMVSTIAFCCGCWFKNYRQPSV